MDADPAQSVHLTYSCGSHKNIISTAWMLKPVGASMMLYQEAVTTQKVACLDNVVEHWLRTKMGRMSSETFPSQHEVSSKCHDDLEDDRKPAAIMKSSAVLCGLHRACGLRVLEFDLLVLVPTIIAG